LSPDEPKPVHDAPVFETDILPIFTDFHRQAMLFRLDLHSYDDVRADHIAILNTLRSGSMPCMEGGGPLPTEQIDRFEAWINSGFLRDNAFSDPPENPEEPPEPAPFDPGAGFGGRQYENHRWRRTNVPAPPGFGPPRYDDIWHFDKHIGWAVNSDGEILATRDGWKTFTRQFHIPQVRLRCIGFANDRVGWVGNIGAAENERLLQTVDGGETWSFVRNLPSKNPRQVCGLWVVDESTVYLAGSNENEGPDPGRATVLKTTDGGMSWSEIDMHAAANAKTLIDVYFEDANRGWVVGGVDTVEHPSRNGRRGDLVPGIFRTLDGGQTWENVVQGEKISASGRPYVGRTGVFPQGEWAWKIQRIDQDTLVVAIQNYRDGAILRSDDGGSTWERLRINDLQRNSNLEGIGFLNRDEGWVGGYGDITYQPGFSSTTRDGGRTWVSANAIGNRINRFRVVGDVPYTVFASGDTIYKYSDDPIPETEQELLEAAVTVPTPLEGWDRIEIQLDVPHNTERLTVRVWERDGRFVRLLEEVVNPNAGPRTVTWDFRNDDDAIEDIGTYLVRVTLDDLSRSQLIYRKPMK